MDELDLVGAGVVVVGAGVGGWVGGASVVGAGAGFEVVPPPAAGCELPPELAAVDPDAPADGVAWPEPDEEDDGTLAPLLADVPDAAADLPADDCVPAEVVAT